VVQGLEARGEGGSGEALAAVETGQPVDLKRLALQCNLSADETRKIVGALVEQGKVVTLGEGDGRLLFTTAGWQSLAGRAKAAVEDYHRKYPARHGMPKVELVSKLGLPPQSPAMRKLFEDGVLSEEGAAVRLPSYQVQLSHDQQALVTAFLSDMELNPCSPTSEVVLEPDLLTLLVEQGKVVKLGDGVVFPSSAYREMVDKIVAYARERGKVTLAEVRDLLGTSRKYAKALLENMDERKLTRRVGDERVLR